MGRIILNGNQYGGGGGGGSADIVEVTLAEYIALGDVVNTDGKLYCITDLNNSDVQGYPPLIYSDEEREVGVWRDGKPLYQKTIYYQGGTNGQIGIPHGIANIEKVVYANGRSRDNYSSSVSYEMPIPRIATDNYNIGVSSIDSTYVNFAVPSAFGSRIVDVYITLQYTKTTDVAGSGIWNGQGGYAHHYSTSEKVIGTWIDGKPLYEKTIVYTPSEAITSSVTIATIANAKVMRVTEATGYNATDNRGYDLPDVRSSGGTKFSYDNGDVVIQTFNDSWNSSWTFYVTVQYTKNTD